MKEAYFTHESIHSQGKELLEEVIHLRKRKEYRFDITKSSLLVLDLQKYFLKESSHAFIPSAPAIIPNLTKLIDLFLENERPIFLTQHLNTDSNAQQMKKWWKELISENKLESELSDKIKNYSTKPKVTIIKKTQYDAFYGTNLEKMLKEENVQQLIISGVMTHLCCETTARSSFVRGFDVIFTVDGTATYNKEHHMATLLNLAHGFAIPMLTQEILEMVE